MDKREHLINGRTDEEYCLRVEALEKLGCRCVNEDVYENPRVYHSNTSIEFDFGNVDRVQFEACIPGMIFKAGQKVGELMKESQMRAILGIQDIDDDKCDRISVWPNKVFYERY